MYLAYSVLAAEFLPNIIVNNTPPLYKLYILASQLIDALSIDIFAVLAEVSGETAPRCPHRTEESIF